MHQSATSIITLGELELMLWLHTRTKPSAAEWEAHIARLRDAKKRRGGDMDKFRSLVISDGAAPAAREREIIFKEVFGGTKAVFAAVSADLSNPVLRGVATVIAWLQPGFRAYEPDRTMEALSYLELTAHTDRVLRELEALQALLPPVRTLALAREAIGRARSGG